jgi:hypothetical protein
LYIDESNIEKVSGCAQNEKDVLQKKCDNCTQAAKISRYSKEYPKYILSMFAIPDIYGLLNLGHQGLTCLISNQV